MPLTLKRIARSDVVWIFQVRDMAGLSRMKERVWSYMFLITKGSAIVDIILDPFAPFNPL